MVNGPTHFLHCQLNQKYCRTWCDNHFFHPSLSVLPVPHRLMNKRSVGRKTKRDKWTSRQLMTTNEECLRSGKRYPIANKRTIIVEVSIVVWDLCYFGSPTVRSSQVKLTTTVLLTKKCSFTRFAIEGFHFAVSITEGRGAQQQSCHVDASLVASKFLRPFNCSPTPFNASWRALVSW